VGTRTPAGHRRRSGIAAAAALLVVGTAVPVALPARADTESTGTTFGALPDRIGVPVIGTLHTSDRPRLGPAAVLFTGRAAGLTGGDEDGVVGVVGADTDRYRRFEVGFEAPAGEQVLLSPDGRTIAYPGSDGGRGCVGLVDLVTGGRRCLAGPTPGSALTVPLGWSVDGRRLVVRETVPVNPERSGMDSVLSMVRVDGHDGHRLTGARLVTGPLSYDGFTVAFAPDQRRLAYQFGGTVTVAQLDGRLLSAFALAPGSRLAGKGAWTPDGTALTVAEPEAGGWVLRRVDPGTGMPVAGPVLPAVVGVTAIRLLGWGPDGGAVVVAADPEPVATGGGALRAIADGDVRTVRVLALTPAAAAPRTLLTAPERVLGIDVADAVVHGGRTRTADPPSGVGPWFWFWAGAVGVALLVIVLVRFRPRPAHWSEPRSAGQ
jgi:hypothetical protein